MPLRTDSSWLTVRCSSVTEDAPSNAPSSISDTLLLLRLLWRGESRLGWGALPRPHPEPCLPQVPLNTL